MSGNTITRRNPVQHMWPWLSGCFSGRRVEAPSRKHQTYIDGEMCVNPAVVLGSNNAHVNQTCLQGHRTSKCNRSCVMLMNKLPNSRYRHLNPMAELIIANLSTVDACNCVCHLPVGLP